MEQHYGGLIWTTHALSRLKERRLDQSTALLAYRHPDEVVEGRERGTKEYHKHIQRSLITMITSKDNRGETIVVSCWINPPLAGTQDERKHRSWIEYQKAPWWKKWLITFRKQLLGF